MSDPIAAAPAYFGANQYETGAESNATQAPPEVELQEQSTKKPLISVAYHPVELSDVYAKDKPQAAVCKWDLGWRVPTAMTVSYLLALAIAITHLVFFRYLNGKGAGGSRHEVPQTYVTTSSTIMSNLFGALMQGCLATAFVQHLWRLVRRSPMEVRLLERLFTMRSNPNSFFNIKILQKAWTLVLMALILWIIPVSLSFPPGAMRVSLRSYNVSTTGLVPTLNLSDIGNGSTDALRSHALFVMAPPSGTTNEDTLTLGAELSYQGHAQNNPALLSLATRVVFGGEINVTPSYCGTNCSYNIIFDGPFLQCENHTSNITYRSRPQDPLSSGSLNVTSVPGYNASWSVDRNEYDSNALDPPYATGSDLIAIQFETLEMDSCSDAIDLDTNDTNDPAVFNMLKHSLSCTPMRARYNASFTYMEGIQSTLINTDNIVPLTNLTHGIPMSAETWPEDSRPEASNGSAAAMMDYYRDANIMALIEATVNPLLGVVEMGLGHGGDAKGCQPYWYTDTAYNPGLYGANSSNFIVPYTRLSSLYDFPTFSLGLDSTTRTSSNATARTYFHVSPDLLNSYLANVTLSILPVFKLSSTNASLTLTLTQNFYDFARPLNLLLPYFLTLVVSLPLLVLGLYSLRANGVAAIDGGFVQLLMTTRGSRDLDRLAARGCLGGVVNVPIELERTRVMFGEFKRDESLSSDSHSAKSSRRGGGTAPTAASDDDNDVDGEIMTCSGSERRRDREEGNEEERTRFTEEEEEREGEGEDEEKGENWNVVRQAGFGTVDEVVPLVKGRLYGGR